MLSHIIQDNYISRRRPVPFPLAHSSPINITMHPHVINIHDGSDDALCPILEFTDDAVMDKTFRFKKPFAVGTGYFAEVWSAENPNKDEAVVFSTPPLSHWGTSSWPVEQGAMGSKPKADKISINADFYGMDNDDRADLRIFNEAYRGWEEAMKRKIARDSATLFRRSEPFSEVKVDSMFSSSLVQDVEGKYPDKLKIKFRSKLNDEGESVIDTKYVEFFDANHESLSLENAMECFEARKPCEYVLQPHLVSFHSGVIRLGLQAVQVVFHERQRQGDSETKTTERAVPEGTCLTKKRPVPSDDTGSDGGDEKRAKADEE